MKVFISWSGDLAKAVAVVLREWLPVIVGGVEPWMSDRDIHAGQRGLDEIAEALDETGFGIIIVTADNQNAPWLNFEAGALSKRFGETKTRVAPLLIDLDRMAQVTGPINQFQGSRGDREGFTRIFRSMVNAASEDWASVERRIDLSWAGFNAALESATHFSSSAKSASTERPLPTCSKSFSNECGYCRIN